MLIKKIDKTNNINKLANIKEKEVPSARDLAAYVESLKLHVRACKIDDPEIKKLICNLPTPKNIENLLSSAELRIIAETIRFLWQKIAGQDIIGESKMEKSSEKLLGNYWMITKGVLLSGPNHCTIIKKNMDLFMSLLDIDAFAMHENMASNPNNLIKLVIDNGAMRIFVNADGKAYFQLSADTYGKWGRRKIKKYDFKEKIVMVIDINAKYNGWKSGIRIKI